jgi:hypothetical protein
MIDDVAASIGRLRHMLDGTVRFATNYDSGPPAWQGTPGSVVAGELAEAPTISLAWETAVRTVLSGLRLQLFTVSRHLKSISNLLATEMPPFGPAILARSALETAARAWWLVDSQIEMRRRVARGLTDRLYSADYAAALAREYGVGDSYFSEPPSRVEGICSDLSLRITGRERNRYVGTEARQTSMKLCADLLRSIDPDPERSANRPSVAFAYYSAISRGTYYARVGRLELPRVFPHAAAGEPVAQAPSARPGRRDLASPPVDPMDRHDPRTRRRFRAMSCLSVCPSGPAHGRGAPRTGRSDGRQPRRHHPGGARDSHERRATDLMKGGPSPAARPRAHA